MKLSTDQLQALLKDAKRQAPPGTVWRHRHGGTYMVLGHGYDTELGRINVHYYRIGGSEFNEQAEKGIIFDRPLFQWTEDRFQKVNVFTREDISASKLAR